MKTKLMTKVPSLICLSFLAIAPVSGFAQGNQCPPPAEGGGCPPGEMKPGMPGGNPLEMLSKRLDLTEEQKTKIKPIIEASMPQMKAIHEEARTKMKAVMEGVHEKIKPMLTPEQQQKLDQMKQQMEAGPRAEGPGAMNGPGNGGAGGPGGPGKNGMNGEKPGERLIKALNLTPEQQKQVQPIMENTRAEMKALHQDATLTPEQKRAKAREIREASNAKIKPLLTPEQQQQLEKMKSERGFRGQNK